MSGSAPWTTRSLTDIATRSIPIVSWRPVSIATLSLVPTPSVAATERVLEAGPLGVKEFRQIRDIGVRAGPGRRANQGLDKLHEPVAGIDIDASGA